ncbi:hypothetical protein [Limobrevibacterium gyesilva]|uniref:Uncharacterized protein n=1 Tax=Limobrevibacterium gyesilva TaxID=2991712 RepID=A0AA42CDY3_9PROT|nr:hypothetical protein [Limobrevibacterium gyesilva]MCW3474529.1 hypothetical protein [Limobrevibacterium gyesilva]
MAHRHDAATHALRVAANGHEVPWNDLLFWPGITFAFHLPATAAPCA